MTLRRRILVIGVLIPVIIVTLCTSLPSFAASIDKDVSGNTYKMGFTVLSSDQQILYTNIADVTVKFSSNSHVSYDSSLTVVTLTEMSFVMPSVVKVDGGYLKFDDAYDSMMYLTYGSSDYSKWQSSSLYYGPGTVYTVLDEKTYTIGYTSDASTQHQFQSSDVVWQTFWECVVKSSNGDRLGNFISTGDNLGISVTMQLFETADEVLGKLDDIDNKLDDVNDKLDQTNDKLDQMQDALTPPGTDSAKDSVTDALDGATDHVNGVIDGLNYNKSNLWTFFDRVQADSGTLAILQIFQLSSTYLTFTVNTSNGDFSFNILHILASFILVLGFIFICKKWVMH